MQTKKIRSFEDLDAMVGRVDHVLTLFSGGLDSSYVLKELADRKLQTTALAVDVGEGCHAMSWTCRKLQTSSVRNWKLWMQGSPL